VGVPEMPLASVLDDYLGVFRRSTAGTSLFSSEEAIMKRGAPEFASNHGNRRLESANKRRMV
jgi:hypothetical protein